MSTLRSRWLTAAVSLGLVATIAACGGTTTETSSAPPAEAGAVDLSADCPATVVIQTDWNPEAEHGAQYALLGSDYTIDSDLKTVKGPLMSKGKSTGVDVEIRAGGPAIGFETVAATMYKDSDITLGYANTDAQIQSSKDLPVKAVMAPLDINPQMIMWDPATYPDVKTIKELSATGAIIRIFGAASYMEYLLDSGQVQKSEVDEGYDGTPANFVAAGGKDAQQGFASAEPYIYENEIKDWAKPVAFQLIHDAGWKIYAATMSVRSDELAELSPCLKKLVPVMQQAEVDYYSSPATTNDLILKLVQEYNTGWVYSQGVADFSVEQQKKLGLVGNGDNAAVGDFDTARVQQILDVMGPIAAKLGTPAKEGLTVDDLVTNEFIDTTIGLPQ